MSKYRAEGLGCSKVTPVVARPIIALLSGFLILALLAPVAPASPAVETAPLVDSVGPIPVALGGNPGSEWTSEPRRGDPRSRLTLEELSQPPSPAPVHPGDDSSEPVRILHPLGDANGDGAADVLLEIVDDGTSLSAISSKDGATIWERSLGSDQTWFFLGDLTGDGVDDLMIESGKSTGGSTSVPPNPAVYGGEYTRTTVMTYVAASGVDGKDLFKKTCTEDFASRYAFADGVVGGGGLWIGTGSYCFLMTAMVGPYRAIDIVRGSFVDAWADAGAAVGFAGAFAGGNYLEVQRFDAKGTQLWSGLIGTPVTSTWIVDVADFTGDGVPDYLTSTLGGAAIMAFAVSAGHFVDAFTPAILTLHDGKDGRLVWQAPIGKPRQWVEVHSAPKLDGKGVDFVVTSFGALAPGPGETLLTTYDGATGSKLRELTYPGEFVMAAGFGDHNADGKGDLLMIRVAATIDLQGDVNFAKEGRFGAVDAELKPLWEALKVSEDDDIEAEEDSPDFDGDGVSEIILGRQSLDVWVLHVHSGATGAKLWSFKEPQGTVGRQAIANIDGSPGMDLAVTWFDVPEGAGSAGGGRSMSFPDEEEPEEAVNMANHSGYLELRRGSDTELIWKKLVHDPLLRPDTFAVSIDATAVAVGDANGDNVTELILNLGSGPAFFFGGPIMIVMEGAQNGGFSEAYLFDGLDGTTLRSYPKALAPAPASLGKAALLGTTLPSPDGSSPALGAAMLVLGLVGVAALRRRYA